MLSIRNRCRVRTFLLQLFSSRQLGMMLVAMSSLITLVGCQTQTSQFELCRQLQIQSGTRLDGTCWLRGRLDPVPLVKAHMLMADSSATFADVLAQIGGKVPVARDKIAQFEDGNTRFHVMCDPLGESKCVWKLISEPDRQIEQVFNIGLLEVVKWVTKDAEKGILVKIALMDEDPNGDTLMVEVVDRNVRSLTWSSPRTSIDSH